MNGKSTIDVTIKFDVPFDVAEGCLKLVQIYLNAHPSIVVLCNEDAYRHRRLYFEERWKDE